MSIGHGVKKLPKKNSEARQIRREASTGRVVSAGKNMAPASNSKIKDIIDRNVDRYSDALIRLADR